MVKLTFPRFGPYTKIIKEFLEDIGLEIILPPRVTKETIKLGVKHSSVMMCYPYKVVLGSFIEALEKGAGGLIMYETKGKCRFHLYHSKQRIVLERLGYKFKMYAFTWTNPLKLIWYLIQLRAKFWRIPKAVIKAWKNIKKTEATDHGDTKIGIVGEIYTLLESDVNLHLIDKLNKLGCHVDVGTKLSDFLRHRILFWKKYKYKKEAKRYLPNKIGGHGFESLYNSIYYAKNNYDGVIHIYPLSCLTGDAQITTKGYISKSIKDIKMGDKVLTHKGRFRRVTKTFCRDYGKEILNIDCGGLMRLNITPEHQILALRKDEIKCRDTVCRPNKIFTRWCKPNGCKKGERFNFNPRFIEASKLKKEDFIAIPKRKDIINKLGCTNDMVRFRKPKYKDIRRLPYSKDILRLIGYYLAEGNINYDSYKGTNKKYLSGVSFTLNIKESYIIQDIEKIINDNFEARVSQYTHPNRPNTVIVSVGNRSFAFLIKKLCKEYCDKKEIHFDLMQLEIEKQLEIVKGFFRGDGCFTDKYGETTYRAVTTSFKLANQLFWILIRNNIKATMMEQNIKDRKKSYMVKIANAEGIKRLKDKTIKVTARKRKVRFIETENYFLTPIKTINADEYNSKVYNLEVEEDNSYMANFLSVHNCMPETTVEVPLNQISQDFNIPLLHISIDESSPEELINTRLEAFVEMIKMRR